MFKAAFPLALLFASSYLPAAWASGFEHDAWDALLHQHVSDINDGHSSVVDYAGMKADHDGLKSYLDELSSVSHKSFESWTNNEQLAFLINAYNAWTVELILSEWPDVESIKDLGSLFKSPWKKSFIPLLGKTRSLDEIEHDLIRGSGKYQDPRIHFAVNCASIGCPALRAEAYTGTRLDQQLQQQTLRFLSDSSRNRITGERIELSSIFKWYREDFEKGWRGYRSLGDFLIAHAEALGMPASLVRPVELGRADIEFLPYDWALNQKHP